MTLFTIPGETTNYHYPDTLADISLWQYLVFLKDIQPSEPPEVKESTTLADMIYQTEKEISRLTHRMPDGMNAVTWLESGQATDKAKRYLPPLISRLKEFTDGWDELLNISRLFKVTASQVINTQTGSDIIFSGIKTSSGNQTAKLKSIQGINCIIIVTGKLS